MGGDRDDDAVLLHAVARGDQAALAALYDRHAGWLFARLTRRCGDPETVREVLQDTFVTVWRSAHTYRGGESGGWLWVIAARRLVQATVARPADGRVELLGHDLSDHRELAAARRALGYLPQDFGYYPGFTVREFLAYVAWLKEMPGTEAGAAVERAVARVGLADRIDAKVKTLSGGMVRRVGIAQAIVNDPAVLLLDEPTAGLDPEQRVEFRSLLRELGTESTVIVSTHLVEDVAMACTEVTLVDSGRVAYRGTPSSLAELGDSAEGTTGSGGNAIERGYTAALRGHRAAEASAAGVRR
ncbi:ATP-binding cassette domain-containing protein [Streptomyces chattanoogensis]|uniref:ATP-binding cassette domain-containing protein n=1 Tax=Streptomyces chattanoogensis TaxID=66876 RepID=UPI003685CCB5